jgi:queuine/archaeosine tRNA-ribosyltransferase
MRLKLTKDNFSLRKKYFDFACDCVFCHSASRKTVTPSQKFNRIAIIDSESLIFLRDETF